MKDSLSRNVWPWRAAAFSMALVCMLCTTTASATVFVPIGDGELADRSPLIIEAKILAVESPPDHSSATDYLVEVRRLIKGQLPDGNPVIRIPGGVREDGLGLHIWGAPKFRQGDSALLFIRPRPDGTFALVQLMLGAFHLETEDDTTIATRDLSEAHPVVIPGKSVPADGRRDLNKFVSWIQGRARGHGRAPDYFLPATEPSTSESRSRSNATGVPDKFFTLVTSTDPPPLGCGSTGGHSVRWFDFDTGGNVGWRTHFSGQPGLDNGGFTLFQNAQEAWNRDPNTPIANTYLGLTATTNGLQRIDNVNAILFDDPNDEIAGTFDGSGLLALGGPRFDCSLTSYEGEEFHPVIEADIVTQDGLELFFAVTPDPSKAAEQLFAHELGHTLGMAHSSDFEALMFAEYHPDLRGAALDTDDLAGALYLYGPRDLSPPEPPTDLTIELLAADGIQLEWQDNSDNESVFRIERRQTAGFSLVTTVNADSASFLDTNVVPGMLYTYRVRAQNGAGSSAYTMEAGIPTPEDPNPAAPSNLRAAPLSSEEIRLTWQDNSNNESGFVAEILVNGGWVVIPTELAADTDKVIIRGLPAASAFAFRIRAFNNFGESTPSNPAQASTFDINTECTVSASELCLLDGRFRVSVEYRNQHDDRAEGDAVAVPSTNESGLFWFFGPENVELIVKLLDGRDYNEHFWVFYGALSDLEYWITITDTQTGVVQTYHNPPGEICGLADTLAFSDSLLSTASTIGAISANEPAPRSNSLEVSSLIVDSLVDGSAELPIESGTCTPGPENLCLLGNRLSVQVQWRNPMNDGAEGVGQAIVDTDNSGFFWFFNIENTELVIKALDGGGLNNHLWIFYGALTDLEFWISITDTVTGTQRVYYNPPGEVCGRADLEAFVLEGLEVPPGVPVPGASQ